MFKFLRERRQREVLELCDVELKRAQGSKTLVGFANSPRDLATRKALLERARVEELAEHPTVRQLDFLQRLLSGLSTEIADRDVPGFIAEARGLGLAEAGAVRFLIEHDRAQTLAARGPEVVERTPEGHNVFPRCQVEHKRQTGMLEVRDDGLTFVGEVELEIPWSKVVHVVKTTYNDGDAIAIQEGKRRTATKFAFWGRDSDHNREVILQAWKRSKG